MTDQVLQGRGSREELALRRASVGISEDNCKAFRQTRLDQDAGIGCFWQIVERYLTAGLAGEFRCQVGKTERR